MPQHYQVEAPTVAELEAKVRARHGSHARILKAERITSPGVMGLFARTICRATVEVPDPVTPNQSASFDLPARVGIAALLDEANAGDTIEGTGQTDGSGFDTELAQLIERGAAEATAVADRCAAGAAPVLLDSPGDLIALVGIDTQCVAQAMSTRIGADVVQMTESGSWDRRGAMRLRAEGVHGGRPSIIALAPEHAPRLGRVL